jgi:hypothetical protein
VRRGVRVAGGGEGVIGRWWAGTPDSKPDRVEGSFEVAKQLVIDAIGCGDERWIS